MRTSVKSVGEDDTKPTVQSTDRQCLLSLSLILSLSISCVGLWHFTLQTLSIIATLQSEQPKQQACLKREIPSLFPPLHHSSTSVCHTFRVAVSCSLEPLFTISLSLFLTGHTRSMMETFIYLEKDRRKQCWFTISSMLKYILHWWLYFWVYF